MFEIKIKKNLWFSQFNQTIKQFDQSYQPFVREPLFTNAVLNFDLFLLHNLKKGGKPLF